jgi:uncharacterized protein YggE
MRRSSMVTALAAAGLVAGGCAAGPAQAGAQTTGPAADAPVRPNVYEVTPEMVAQEAPDPIPFIQVSGTGSVDVAPDRARIRFAVETQAPTARTASQQNAERMDAVMAALRGTNAPGLDIETSGYDLQPVYARPDRDGAPRITAYRALNHVLVTVDDVTAAGRLIDAAIGAGANRVASLSFEARDPGAARLEALQLAVERARQEAEAMAAAMGVPLGPPMEVHGGAQVPGPRPMYRMEAAVMDQSTPIEAGDQTITANVTIKYRLGR